MPRRRAVLVLTSGVALTGLLTGLPASRAAEPSAHLTRALQGGDSGDFPGAEVPVGDADRRGPDLAPSAHAKAALARLPRGAKTSWTQYGTPHTLTRPGSFLATGLSGSPEQVARTFLSRNAALYGLSATAVDALELVSADPLPDSTTAWAVLLRQKLAGMRVAEDGLVAVGVGAGGNVAYVTSSLVPTGVLGTLKSTTPAISPQAALVAAAKDAGITGLATSDISLGQVNAAGFQTMTAKGLHQPQLTRLRVLPTTNHGARLVYETDVTDVAAGRALATMSFVDAETGAVLLRRDAVDTLAAGKSTAATRYVGTSPAGEAPAPPPVTDGKQSGPSIWHVFGSNPRVPLTMTAAADTRYKACSGRKGDANLLSKDVGGCDYVYTDGSPLPYDSDPLLGLPTFTTVGNNAITSDARLSSSLTPGAPFLPPTSPTREYQPAWTDSWHTSDCDPASIAGPNQSDINTAIVNLFAGHNRTHDFAYRLGLTEKRGALQTSNFGRGGVEGDPELGNAQNAALSQEAFAAANTAGGPAGQGAPLTGRNNANQITMQDGVPGITNQYLFQPVPTFHGPCADGDLDSGIFLHEYTHAISNRLIAGPDTGLSGQQGGSMGESWSDLVAVEYLNAFGLAGGGGESKTALGAYATGNVFKGIRDYNADPKNNPLNYSDMGFDSTGPEVHADGEIWNAVQMTVRQALIDKYNSAYPYSNKALQKACAVGRTASGAPGPKWNKCPGNRRYITYMFDAMIGQANGAPSMVDMKDVELASVLLRDKGDYDTVAEAFARRGLGTGSDSAKSGDTDPTPSFAGPKAADNTKVTFSLVDASTGAPVKGSIYVGMYEARCVPVATTLGDGEIGTNAVFTKGTYAFTVQAAGYGIQRFTATYAQGARTQVFRLAKNLASKKFGPSVTSNAGGLRLGGVLDDTEATNGAFNGQPVAGRQITVKFATPKQTFDRVAVSALHHPAKTLPEGGTEIEGRFLGIRAFDLQTSNDGGRTFTTIYRSPSNFFPSVRPRPVAPDLINREVTFDKPVTADAIRLVIRSSACTGNSQFSTEEEADPAQPSACLSMAGYATQVTVTELEVFKAG
jgi:extracellular elastinolytic metalloproteinase